MKYEKDFRGSPVPAMDPRVCRGMVSASSGRLGEHSVSRDYLARGYELIAERWRGKGGEIDLILCKDGEYVFVEVKSAAFHDWAAERISRRQIARIFNAAQEFCGRLPSGSLTEMRFDAALVDQYGRVEIRENALGMN